MNTVPSRSATVAMGRNRSQVAWIDAFMNVSMPMQNSSDRSSAARQRFGSMEQFVSALSPM